MNFSVGSKFDWRELPERKASRIVIEKNVAFGDKNQWNAQFDWLICHAQDEEGIQKVSVSEGEKHYGYRNASKRTF